MGKVGAGNQIFPTLGRTLKDFISRITQFIKSLRKFFAKVFRLLKSQRTSRILVVDSPPSGSKVIEPSDRLDVANSQKNDAKRILFEIQDMLGDKRQVRVPRNITYERLIAQNIIDKLPNRDVRFPNSTLPAVINGILGQDFLSKAKIWLPSITTKTTALISRSLPKPFFLGLGQDTSISPNASAQNVASLRYDDKDSFHLESSDFLSATPLPVESVKSAVVPRTSVPLLDDAKEMIAEVARRNYWPMQRNWRTTDNREEDVEAPSKAEESRGKVVYWPKRALVPDREVEQGLRTISDLLASKGLTINVDTKEAVVSSEAEESREENVEAPSKAEESRGKVVYWPKRALVSDREVEQGVRAVRDLLFALEGVVSSESGAAGLMDVDTKEAVESSEAEESRDEDVEVPSSAAESLARVSELINGQGLINGTFPFAFGEWLLFQKFGSDKMYIDSVAIGLLF